MRRSVRFVFTDTPCDTEHALFLYPLYPMTMLHARCWVLLTVRYVNPPRANAARSVVELRTQLHLAAARHLQLRRAIRLVTRYATCLG